jgi:hypothetical protein
MNFIVFFIKWVANNLSIPFWAVGHVHLSMNVYNDLVEIVMSLGMNFLVAIGFWLDWREFKEKNSHRNHKS